jgi:hypothetical protein
MSRYIAFLLGFYLLVAAGCDTQQAQDDFAEQAAATPSGFTRTDHEGDVLDEDEDDWRTAPVYQGSIRIDPAYPNPQQGEISLVLWIHHDVDVGGRFTLWGRTASEWLESQTLNGVNMPGSYPFTINPTYFSAEGLYRIFVFDGYGEIVTYGDIMIE